MKPHLYLFRGAPASGKSTLSKKFGESLGKPAARLAQDHWRYGVHMIGRMPDDIGGHENILADGNLFLLLEEYLKNRNYDVIVEGSFTWDTDDLSHINAKMMKGMAKKYGWRFSSIVLKPTLHSILSRNANESRATKVRTEDVRRMYATVYAHIDPSEIVIDSTGKTVKQTLKLIQAAVR